MLNITVKTLDSQNHFFSVPDDLSVRSFKENIASAVGIPPDKQRLIYCGRVLQDDKKLNEYDADGKVIHLVQRPPPATSGRPTSSSFPNPDTTALSQSQSQSQRPEFVHRLGGHDGNSFVLGAFTIPSEAMDSNHVQQIVQQVVSGMGELGRNATVMSRTSDDGSTVDVHINLGQVPLQGDAQNRISLILNMIRRANNCINRLENPSNTTPVNEEAQNEENSRSEQGTPASDTHGPMEETDTAPRQSTDENAAETHEAGTPMRPTIISSGFASIADAARMAATAAFAAATSAARATGLATNYSNSSRLASQQTPTEQQHQGGNDTMNPSFRASTPTQHTPQATHPPALVNALNELQALHSRFQPFLNQYLDCLREDRSYQDNTEEQTRAQSLFNCASSVMHYMSHAYHAASDIMIDMSQTPPRSLRCRPVIVQQPAMIQAGVPVQAHINVSTTLNAARASGQATSSNTSVNTSTNSSVASSTLSSTVSSDNSNAVPPPPPPASEQASPNTPIIGAIPSSVASLFSSSNPFVVMELGPSSITIDSISAVTSEGSGSQPVHISGSRFPEVVVQQAPSQDLIQNLMQAVGQTAAQRFGVNGQSQARGNTATHPTTSTQTRSTSRPIQTIPLAIPGFPIATFDPYLPCSSRHVTTFHRPLVPVRTMQPPQSQQQPQTAGSGGGGSNVPLDAQLAGMVANVMSAFFSNSGSSSSAVGSSGSPRTRAQVPSGFPRILVDLMSQWRVRQAAGEASQYSTIADFLRSLPDFNYQEGEGLLSDMMMCIARHISLREFIEVLFGRTEILSRLRCHLQQFVRTNVLRGKDPTATNIQAAVTEIVNSIIEELRIVKGDIEVKDGIDYLATMRNFCEQKLLSLINLILSSDNEAEFGSTLYGLCRQIISEYIGLDLHCFKHGQQAVIHVVQNRVRRVASDMDPFTQQWMISWCSSQIRGIISNISTEETDILRYVIQSRESSSAPRQGTSMTFETQESASSQSDEAGTSPMEVDIVNSNSSESFLIPAATSGNGGSIANRTLAESNVSSMLSSGPAWTSAVPADWVPMITEDIERQRRQSTQRPFSDAYLGMMSSKRRKVMSNGRLQAVVDTANILPDTIRRAVAAAGVQPTTSVNELTQDVAGNATLNSVFEEHLCKAICKRLNEDKDYRPEKFPNAENVFNNKPDSGDNV